MKKYKGPLSMVSELESINEGDISGKESEIKESIQSVRSMVSNESKKELM